MSQQPSPEETSGVSPRGLPSDSQVAPGMRVDLRFNGRAVRVYLTVTVTFNLH